LHLSRKRFHFLINYNTYFQKLQTFTYIFFHSDILKTMTTDFIILGALLFFFIRGWYKGILKTLLAPISLVVGCLLGFLHYRQTQNIAVSLSICVLSPFALRILVSLILKLWDKAVNKDKPLSMPSRVFGSIFGVLWSGSYLVLMLVLIGFIPLNVAWFEKIQNDVLASKSYTTIHRFMDKKTPSFSSRMKNISAIMENPAKLQHFQSTKEFETLIKDDTLKEIFADEELAEQIRNKDYGKLLANPKMQTIMQDEQLLEKIFALNRKIIEESLDDDLFGLETTDDQ